MVALQLEKKNNNLARKLLYTRGSPPDLLMVKIKGYGPMARYAIPRENYFTSTRVVPSVRNTCGSMALGMRFYVMHTFHDLRVFPAVNPRRGFFGRQFLT
jgi:hypothetical protein